MAFEALKAVLDELVEQYHTPGVDCIVYQGHQEIFRYYRGLRDVEDQLPTTPETLYQIFSMTKLMTCTCALQLWEQGKYDLDDPVWMYLPEYKTMELAAGGQAETPITIRHLFTMSAGLDYNRDTPAITRLIEEHNLTTRTMAQALSKTKLRFTPGSRMYYSFCHDVLGALVEVWSGMRFGEYMQACLFQPLGIRDAFFGAPRTPEEAARMAKQYRYDKNRLPQPAEVKGLYHQNPGYDSGGAGMNCTTEAYSIFLDALANGGVGKNGSRILKDSTVALMQTNQLSGKALEDFDQLRKGYGYGMGVRTHLDPERSGSLSPIGEFGWDGAAGGFAMVDVQNKLSMVYLQEVHNWDMRIHGRLRNALYSEIA